MSLVRDTTMYENGADAHSVLDTESIKGAGWMDSGFLRNGKKLYFIAILHACFTADAMQYENTALEARHAVSRATTGGSS